MLLWISSTRFAELNYLLRIRPEIIEDILFVYDI